MEVKSVLKLMSLEIKKYRLTSYIFSSFCTLFALIGIMALVMSTYEAGRSLSYDTLLEVVNLSSVISCGTVLIYSATILSKVIIGEYENKNISVLFSYPISRKKILLSKLLLIGIFTLIFMLVSNVLVVISSYFTLLVVKGITLEITANILLLSSVKIITSSITFTFLVSISFFFGMRKKSTVTAILSAILVTCLLSSGTSGNNLGSFILVPISIAIIGVILTALTINKIETTDVV